MLLNVVFESWVLEDLSEVNNVAGLDGSGGIGHVSWVLVHVKLDTWVLEDGLVVFGTGILEGIVVEFNSWLLAIQHRFVSDKNSWVGVSVVGDVDSLVGNDDTIQSKKVHESILFSTLCTWNGDSWRNCDSGRRSSG